MGLDKLPNMWYIVVMPGTRCSDEVASKGKYTKRGGFVEKFVHTPCGKVRKRKSAATKI